MSFQPALRAEIVNMRKAEKAARPFCKFRLVISEIPRNSVRGEEIETLYVGSRKEANDVCNSRNIQPWNF